MTGGIGAKMKYFLKKYYDKIFLYIYNSANITINSQLFRGPAVTPPRPGTGPRTGGWEPLMQTTRCQGTHKVSENKTPSLAREKAFELHTVSEIILDVVWNMMVFNHGSVQLNLPGNSDQALAPPPLFLS